MPQLIVIRGVDLGRQFPLLGSVVVGRHSTNPIQLHDNRISRRHFELLATAEGERKDASDALALAENALKAAQSASKVADHDLSHAREERARCEAVLAAQQERLQESITRARDTLDCAPEELAAKAEHHPGDALPALDAAEARAEQLKREREQLGGVNLRAEEEADECETRLTGLQTEKNDLEEAIARLPPRGRKGIQW